MLAYGSILNPEMSLSVFDTKVDGLDHLPKDEFKHMVSLMTRATQCAIEAQEGNWGGLSEKELSTGDRANNLSFQLKYNMKVLQAVCMRGEQLELGVESRTLRALSRHLDEIGRQLESDFSGRLVNRIYMFETPEDTAKDLLRLLDPKLINDNHWCRAKYLRTAFWQTFHDRNLWRFVDWTATDNRRGEDAWRQFITDLGKSKILIHQADSLAFAYQNTRDGAEQNRILMAYCTLLESRAEDLATTEGQRLFIPFSNYPYRKDPKTLDLAFEARKTDIMTRLFRSGVWMGSDAILSTAVSTGSWSRAVRNGETAVPESKAVELLDAVENYVIWAKKDPRWKTNDQIPVWLAKIPTDIVASYPNLTKARIMSRQPIPGAVPIQAWRPEIPGQPVSRNGLFHETMVPSGNSLFIPRIGEGVVELDVSTMAVSRLIKLSLEDLGYIASLAVNRSAMMITIKSRMFRTSLSGDGSSWDEIKPPGENGGEGLTWTVKGFEDDFFVGSRNSKFETDSPRLLAGLLKDTGDVQWRANSDRRPPVNPIDRLDPRGASVSYRNKDGKTMMLLGGRSKTAPLVELETGREAAVLSGGGVDQMRGEMPAYWASDYDKERGGGIRYMLVFDPTRDKPHLIFKSKSNGETIPQMWRNTEPLHDASKPEFHGTLIAPIFHGGYLWLLKREPEEPTKIVKNDPEGLRLIRLDLDGGKAVTVPLTYRVPESIQKLEFSEQPEERRSLRRPVINSRSLAATPKGLFSAPCGFDGIRFAGDFLWAGDVAPVLLYITWDDIHAWISKNAPDSR